jgi:hypothetical protein
VGASAQRVERGWGWVGGVGGGGDTVWGARGASILGSSMLGRTLPTGEQAQTL